jgi:glycosyltransferase involved in cell wall biosynthesis
MSQRLVIITEIISPYRIPLFNALANRTELQLHVIFLAETDPVLREWNVYKNEIKFSFEVLRSWRKRIAGTHFLLNRGVTRALGRADPTLILCGGYNYLASWQAQRWARHHNVPFLLWSESHARDMRSRLAAVELLKSEFVAQCTGFVVPGKAAFEYLRTFKISEERIFTALNAVDNDFFANNALFARQNARELRSQLNLPTRYFLFTGRLVKEKGIFELLSAYAKLDGSLRKQIGLVFVGNGPSRDELQNHAASDPSEMIRFVGFVQRELLPTYYALAEIMVLPTYTDPWGLVVNEAMACGLPILVSEVAGCAIDLVTENWNGKIVPARNVEALAAAMHELAKDPAHSRWMGANSSTRIQSYSPERWAEGVVQLTRKAEAIPG